MQNINVKNCDCENLFAWITATEGDDIYIICADIETAARHFLDYQYLGIASEKHVRTKRTAHAVSIDDNGICNYHFTNTDPLTQSDDNAVIFRIEGDCTFLSDRTKIIKAL